MSNQGWILLKPIKFSHIVECKKVLIGHVILYPVTLYRTQQILFCLIIIYIVALFQHNNVNIHVAQSKHSATLQLPWWHFASQKVPVSLSISWSLLTQVKRYILISHGIECKHKLLTNRIFHRTPLTFSRYFNFWQQHFCFFIHHFRFSVDIAIMRVCILLDEW